MPEKRREFFPLPFIRMPPAPLNSNSRRSWQRAASLAACTDVFNKLAASVNFLYSRTHHAHPSTLPHLTHIHQTQYQQQQGLDFSTAFSAQTLAGVGSLLEAAWQFVDRRDNCDSSDWPPDADSHTFTEHSQAQPDSLFNYRTHAQALPVVVDRLSLPSSASSVDMLGALTPAMRELYSDPRNILRTDPPIELPKAANYASSHEYVKLLQTLRVKDMLGATLTPKAVNGFHSTEKSGGKLRLILNAKPANALFTAPPKTTLPNPGIVAQLLHAQPSQIFTCKTDMSNFFYQFRLPDAYLPFFALPPVRARTIGFGAEYGDDTVIYPCLNRLPMGWSHSVTIAQDAHRHLVYSSGLLSPSDEITVGGDTLLTRTRHCIYIDDLVLISSDPTHIAGLQRDYIDLAQRHGFPVNADKTVLPTSRPTDVLGVQLDGLNGTYGVSLLKLGKLVSQTEHIVRRGWASGDEVESLIGSWTWAMLVRRPTLAVFSAVYRFIRTASYRVFNLWPSVAAELRAVVGLAPLMFVDLRTGFFDRVVASDASMSGLGVVAAPMDEQTQAQTSRATGVEPALANMHVNDQPITVALRARWYSVVSARWHTPLPHINVGELHATLTAVKWVSSHAFSHGRRLLLFSDSTTVVGALHKGRSSAFTVLSLVRSISAILLMFNVRLCIVWLPSAANPADGPSRSQH